MRSRLKAMLVPLVESLLFLLSLITPFVIRGSRGWLGAAALLLLVFALHLLKSRYTAGSATSTGSRSDEAPAAKEPIRGGARFPAVTELLASDRVKKALAHSQNFASLAVDDGVALYVPARSLDFDRRSRVVRLVDADQSTPDLTNPTREQLIKTLAAVSNGKVRRHLQGRIKNGAVGTFRAKAGLRRLDYPNDRVDQPLTLHLSPLSYWVVDQFNRRMLREHADQSQTLFHLREECARQILSGGQHVVFPCPSALYVEVALVTSDGKLVLLEKHDRKSDLAYAGLRWTCSIEEGVEWRHVGDDGALDLEGVAVEGAGLELAIKPAEIDHVQLSAIALESTHLNTGVLGTMRLRISARALEPRIADAQDFVGHKFVSLQPISRAIDRLFGGNEWSQECWHPTARLRALLALERLSGRDELVRHLQRTRSK